MGRVTLENVCLDYPLDGGTIDLTRSWLLKTTRFQRDSSEKAFRALNNITINFSQGDRVAVVGANGSGKTTFLRVISGIYTPTQGRIETTGDVFSLLNPMMGFDGEASGYENIFIRSLALGASIDDIQQKTDDIVAFTELGDAIRRPVRTYSAGMTLRLAFAISTAYTPDILVMDELIGGGDQRFMEKASTRFESFIERTGTLFVASHSVGLIKRFCTSALWLEEGKVKAYGALNDVLAKMSG
ncbi:MAG: ABC transporter ATP-binding protein [Pseudomonadota bacterium]